MYLADFSTPKGIKITPSYEKKNQKIEKSTKRKVIEWKKKGPAFLLIVISPHLWRLKKELE